MTYRRIEYETYIDEKLARHMVCRVGIENWPGEAITKWVQNYFSAKKLPFVITEAEQVYNRYIEKLINRPDPIFAEPVKNSQVYQNLRVRVEKFAGTRTNNFFYVFEPGDRFCFNLQTKGKKNRTF